MQVTATLSIRPEGIPTGGNSCKGLDVVTIAARIEQQHVSHRLEQGEISVWLSGVLEDVTLLHILFVGLYHRKDAVVDLVNR